MLAGRRSGVARGGTSPRYKMRLDVSAKGWKSDRSRQAHSDFFIFPCFSVRDFFLSLLDPGLSFRMIVGCKTGFRTAENEPFKVFYWREQIHAFLRSDHIHV